jgi:oligopeptidase A
VLDVATERLGRAWGAVATSTAWPTRPSCAPPTTLCLPKVTEFWTRLGADERLYAKYKAIDPSQLNHEQRQAHRNALRNFVLGGAELEGADRERFARDPGAPGRTGAEIQRKRARRHRQHSAYLATEAELDGVPSDVKQTARAAAPLRPQGRTAYKLTLKMPCYLPVMQFAHDARCASVLYRAYVTRASDQADREAMRSTTRR